MAKRSISVLVTIAVVAVAAFAGTARGGVRGMAPLGPAGVSTMKAPFDQQFIDMMAAHHQMAIQMAQMALMSAKHPQAKAIARQMIAAQKKEISQFHKLRKQWYGDSAFKVYPMDAMMMGSMGMPAGMMRDLMRAKRFDYEFLSGMIPHHAGAITMANWEIKSGTHAALKSIAANIVRDQAKEIGRMIGWRISWYGA